MAKKKSMRPDVRVRTLLIALILNGLVRMILTYFTGEAAAGAAFVPMQLTLIGFFVFLVVLRRGVRSVIRQYAAKKLYLNAQEEYRRAMFKTLAPSILIGAVVIVLCEPLAKLSAGSEGAFPGILIAGITMLTFGLQGVISGFFDGLNGGHGTGRYALMADVVRMVFSAAGGVALSIVLYRYGMKVDALLLSDDNRYIYGAFGLLCGILIGNLLALLVLLVCMLRFRKTWKGLVETSEPKYLTDAQSILRTSTPLALSLTLPEVSLIAAAIVYVRAQSPNGFFEVIRGLGVFDTHYFALLTTIAFLLLIPQLREVFAAGSLSGKEPGEKTTARVLRVLHRLAIRVFPVSTLIMALSAQAEGLLFTGRSDEGHLMLAYGSLLTAAAAFGIVAIILLQLMKKHHLLIMNGLVSAVCGAVVAVPVCAANGRAVHGLSIACFVMMAVLAVAGCYSLSRVLVIDRRYMIQVLLTPLLAAAVSALVVFFVANLTGTHPAVLIIGLVAGALLYLVLLTFFGGLTDAEAKAIPGASGLKSAGVRARAYARDGMAERRQQAGKRKRHQPKENTE